MSNPQTPAQEHLNAEFQAMDVLAYAHGKPEVSATIKQEFEDFQVDEELGFDFTGDGEHLCVRVRKTDLSTPDIARRLQTATDVPLKAIGYAGMKDRRGDCTQWFSLQIPVAEEHRVAAIEDAMVSILETRRNARKLKIGSHKLNHFQLRLRHCQGAPDLFESRLHQIGTTGVPNYFGSQRFGRDMSNLTQVQALMAAVMSPATGERQVRAPVRQRLKRGMLYSAARSYLFNQVVSQRIEAGNWNTYVVGDVLNLAGTDRCFAVGAGGWDAVLQQRLQELDIHLTGPLAGAIDPKDKYISRGEAADIEDAVLQQYPTLVQGLERCGLTASRRALRFAPLQMSWEWEAEGILRVRFALSKGCYATSLLRELCTSNSPE